MDILVKVITLKQKKVNIVPLGKISDVKSGLSSGDNQQYLYKKADALGPYQMIDVRKVLTEEEMNKIRKDEKLRLKIAFNGIPKGMFHGKTIVPHDKGGSSDIEVGRLNNYYSPTQFFIDYSEENVERIKTLTVDERNEIDGVDNIVKFGDKVASRFQNVDYYFKSGITFPKAGMYVPTFRLNSSSVFDSGGNCLFVKKDIGIFLSNEFLLGILCSKLIRYILKNFINNSVNMQVDDIKKLPIPICDKVDKIKIEKLVKTIIEKQKKDIAYDYHKHEQREIDSLVYKIFELDVVLIEEIENWFIRKYPKLANQFSTLGAR